MLMYVGRHTTYRAAVTGRREALVLLVDVKFKGEVDAQNQSEKKNDDVTPETIARKAWSNCRCQFRTFAISGQLTYCG